MSECNFKVAEKSIERNIPLNAPTIYHIVTHLNTCPFDSHLCSIVNL